MVGQWIKLLIQWDQENRQFIFQRDDWPEEIRPYTVLDDDPPNNPGKRIGISVYAPACSVGAQRPVGYADVVVKNVFVNESALLE